MNTPSKATATANFDLEQVRAEVSISFESWRYRLLSAKALAKLAEDLGLGWFTSTEIIGLWKIGILRADLIISEIPINENGLRPLEGLSQTSEHVYGDFRYIKYRPKGYGSALQNFDDRMFEDSLAFHPFRIYVLHHVKRTLRVSTTNMQFLVFEPGVLNVARRVLESARRWTSSSAFSERFHYWNQIAEVSAVVEPITYNVIFRDYEPEPIDSQLNSFESAIREMFISFGKTALQKMITDLAFAAETLDNNRSVHVLLRLMNWQEREKLKGQLGCSMHFLAMAESIRRAAEKMFGETWPEEDEIGPGQWFPGARKRLYGHDRVFDAPRRNLRDYLTLLGLDFGVKVRCYVEGETEYGALLHAVGSFDHVQLVNLSGNVAEKRGKGLAFVESLKADKKSGIFSVVVLDGDRPEYVRVLRRAAEEGHFHGRFFICEPDVECGNFSPQELVEVAIKDCERNSRSLTAVDFDSTELLSQSTIIRSNGDLEDFCKKHGLTQWRKSESWGKALMEFAIRSPNLPCGHPREGQKRPIVEAAELLIRMRDIGFIRSLTAERLDPNTGQTIRVKSVNDNAE